MSSCRECNHVGFVTTGIHTCHAPQLHGATPTCVSRRSSGEECEDFEPAPVRRCVVKWEARNE